MVQCICVVTLGILAVIWLHEHTHVFCHTPAALSDTLWQWQQLSISGVLLQHQQQHQSLKQNQEQRHSESQSGAKSESLLFKAMHLQGLTHEISTQSAAAKQTRPNTDMGTLNDAHHVAHTQPAQERRVSKAFEEMNESGDIRVSGEKQSLQSHLVLVNESHVLLGLHNKHKLNAEEKQDKEEGKEVGHAEKEEENVMVEEDEMKSGLGRGGEGRPEEQAMRVYLPFVLVCACVCACVYVSVFVCMSNKGDDKIDMDELFSYVHT